ncbi:MAG: UDP-N-acetylmuramoyl-tripeptide--D-alanyl-D-alanine ligase [Flavobacteriaceae bacterium]
MDIQSLHNIFLQCFTANTDTRKINKNDLFFALKGESFNGNTFAQKALEAGAKYAVIDEREFAKDDRYIVVNNVLETLQKLASYHRSYLNLPIIALTGSNGKTTTKELINCVLSKKFKTVATKGNLNNHIGVPLTLLSMTKETEMGIVEMGANHLKEIEFLANIAQPDYGYITNFGKAHLEGFGSVEGIIKGKSELYDFLNAHEKLIFVNGHDVLQMQKTEHSKRYIFGSNKALAKVHVEMKDCNPNVSVLYEGLDIKSHLIGEYNFSNIGAAIAIGSYFNVQPNFIKEAIESYVPSNNRSQILHKGNNKIILDAYNANPTSMEAAIRNMDKLPVDNKILILGDMFELGNSSAVEHQTIVDLIESKDFEKVLLVGKNFYKTKNSSQLEKFKSFEDLKSNVHKLSFNNATILIKGSRGMALERVLELL